MTDPSELPASFFSATKANPSAKGNLLFDWRDDEYHSGGIVGGFVAWLALIVSLIALGLAVAK